MHEGTIRCVTIAPSFIQDLLSRADIVDIVGRYVPLKKGGANFMGLCPFHGEKSPSFSVSPAKQFYHCFGCGKTGNAIGFLMEHTGMGFVEAVHDLAQQYGLQVPDDETTSPLERARAAQQRARQTTMTDVLEKAARGYTKCLRQSEAGIAYLKARGVSGETAKIFSLGYAPEGWRALAGIFADYSDPLLVESGLVISGEATPADSPQPGESTDLGAAKRYDRFRGRVMFPIRNGKGECIGFGGRVMNPDEKPKYLNSPETPVFSKGRELYGLFEARTALREKGFALVTEGYMDVVALAQHGYANAVATLGTACTAEHIQKLFRSTESVIFSFDGDPAGQRAARKALESALPFATDVRSVKFLFLPAEHDPDSFIRSQGQEAFGDYIKEAVPLSRFLLQTAGEGCDLQTSEGRSRTASQAQPLWSLLPEGTLRHQVLAEIADLVLMDSRELLSAWQPAIARAAAQTARRYKNASSSWTDSVPYNPKTSLKNAPQSSQQSSTQYHSELSRVPHNTDAGFESAADYFSGGTGSVAPPWESDASVVFPEQGNPALPNAAGYKTSSASSFGLTRLRPASRVAGRILPVSREDRLLRLLLTEPQHWERLSSSEQHLLAALPAPHGPLLVWLEGQLHEHGPKPWAEMQAGLDGHVHQAYAMAQLALTPDGVQPDWQELRGILAQLVRQQREREIAALAARAPTEPGVFERLRLLLDEDRAEKKGTALLAEKRLKSSL